MDREDAKAIPWMAKFTRDPQPPKVTWLQDDVTHVRFYWLAIDDAKPGARVEIERDGQALHVVAAAAIDALRIRLDDAMLDLDRDVSVRNGDHECFRGRTPRTIEMLARTLRERGDPRGMYSAEIVVPLAK